jgi:hypothetical protein
LDAAKGTGKGDLDVAREYTGEPLGKDKRAKSLLSQIRRMKRKKRLDL